MPDNPSLSSPRGLLSPEARRIASLLPDRYLVVEEIGRGGMGVVVRVLDSDFQRQLAVKVLLAADSATRGRFLEEAQVTAQLQHPGIPPVHEIGQLADGRPWFSMKLIQGRTLAELLTERMTGGGGEPRSEHSEWVGVFQQIARTLGYAHAQGVIHRDLKPHNVMVGEFGEVQVMDWGLARRLGRSPSVVDSRADHTAAADREPPSLAVTWMAATPASGGEETLSHDGDTPAADSRTQAGQVLGTLAYMAPEQARGELHEIDQRSDVFGLGAILCTILTGLPPYAVAAGHADAREMWGRARAGDLSLAWERLRASAADAELVSLARDCLAPQPQHRPADAGAVAQRIDAYLAGVQDRLERARAEQAAAEVQVLEEVKRRRLTRTFRGIVMLLLFCAVAAGAWYQQDRAVRRAGEASRLALDRMRHAQAEREIREALDEAQQQRTDLHQQLSDPIAALELTSDATRWQRHLDVARAAWHRASTLSANAALALAPDLLSEIDLTERALQADERDHRWAVQLEQIRLEASSIAHGRINEGQAPMRYETVFADAGLDLTDGEPGRIAATIRDSSIRWHWIASIDHWAAIEAKRGAHRSLLQVARLADEQDSWREQCRDEEVWSDLRACQALASDPAATRQSPALVIALSRRLQRSGGDGRHFLQQVILRQPQDFWLHFELGLQETDPVECAASFRTALAVRPKTAAAHNNLGVALWNQQQFENAVLCFEQALRLEPNYSLASCNRGVCLVELQQREEAIAAFRESIRLDPQYAFAHNDLGVELHAAGRFAEAERCFDAAVRLDPAAAHHHFNLGNARREQGRLQEAILCYSKALEIDSGYLAAWTNLGHTSLKLGDIAQAMDAYRRSLDIDSANPRVWTNLGICLKQTGRIEEGVEAYQAALERDPLLHNAHNSLGVVRFEQGRIEEALASYQKAVDLAPQVAEYRTNLGMASLALGRVDQAMVAFEQSLAIDEGDAEAQAGLGSCLLQQGRSAESIVAFDRAIALNGELATAHFNRGLALYTLQRFSEARDAAGRALELLPPQDPQRSACAEFVERCRSLAAGETLVTP